MPLAGSHQPLAVVVGHTPEEVFVHIAESVALAGEDEHVETLVGADEGIDDTDRVRRMHIVVDITVHEHEVALQVGGNLRIGLDGIYEGCVACLDLLFDSVMLFAPPAVVDVVVMVARARNGCLEEVRVLEHGSCGHESAA